MGDELAALLGVPEPRPETRQCLLRSAAAALLVKAAQPPNAAEVTALATNLRLELARGAAEAARAWGLQRTGFLQRRQS